MLRLREMIVASLLVTSLVCGTVHAASTSAFGESLEREAAGKLAEALAALDQAPASLREGYVGQLRRGWLLYQLGKHSAAVESYKRAGALAPRAVEAKLGLLLPLLAERRFADAQKAARGALRLEPGNYLATLRLAYACYSLGQYAEALSHYRKLAEAYPGDVEVRSGVGWTLVKLGKGAEATGVFRELLEIAPKHALAKEGLASLNGR